ncbi:hypothetical protein ACFFLZ_17290 [Photobacterium aphoticum]|uniref:DUF304 domain-containing protein n=1 Tax=Photobacterium aphoticum TaxID=754436 RepID=A0A0J1GMH0_9GAMM|nr:hypothetical protein [Photobacterium aphoticum]KLV00945.1 hypothetical protein ABT58_10360 [Photobacterium aphoticum]PSU58883.1 hypothetical protein C9I90_05125 [Photobacterium aphoticum]GHA58216.1 hypothetical protein GCM10007086_35160 [Photobacterium aphoticum]
MSEHAVNKITTHYEGHVLHIHKSWFTFKSLIILAVYFQLIQIIGMLIHHNVLPREYTPFFTVHYFVFSWLILAYLFFATFVNHSILIINDNMLIKYNAPLPWGTKKIIYLNQITHVYPSASKIQSEMEGEKIKHYALVLDTLEGDSQTVLKGVETKEDIDFIVNKIKEKLIKLDAVDASSVTQPRPSFFQ